MDANQHWYLGFVGLPKGTSWMQNATSICDLAASLGVQPSDHRPADGGKVLGATPCQKHLISIRENGLRSRFSGSRTPPPQGRPENVDSTTLFALRAFPELQFLKLSLTFAA